MNEILKDILQTMMDIQNDADNTLWITNTETVFERLWGIYIDHGGDIDRLTEVFPLCY